MTSSSTPNSYKLYVANGSTYALQDDRLQDFKNDFPDAQYIGDDIPNWDEFYDKYPFDASTDKNTIQTYYNEDEPPLPSYNVNKNDIGTSFSLSTPNSSLQTPHSSNPLDDPRFVKWEMSLKYWTKYPTTLRLVSDERDDEYNDPKNAKFLDPKYDPYPFK